MKKIVISSAALILLSTTLTYAQEEQWYVGIEGSYSILKKETSQGTLLNLNTHFKDGVGVGGVVGYDFGMFRLEGEIGKHFHSLDRFTIINDGGLGLGGSSNQNALSGKSNATHYMMNAILDGGDLINMGSIEPFVGGGLGITNVKWSNFATSSNSLSSNADTVFGYQVFGGLRAALSPSVEVSLKYRYMDTGKSTRADRLGNAFKSTYDIHDVVVGLVYRFGAEKNTEIAKMPQPIKVITPKPVAMPDIEPAAGAAAVQPPPISINKGPHSIYFAWDSVEIDSAAQQAIDTAVVESGKATEITIKVDGYADRSGPEYYNDNLSLRRAEVVKSMLITKGIDASAIIIQGHGERAYEVETADGVKERRNRRVVIMLR